MGIYFSNNIYGIFCEHFSFKYDNPITIENIREIKAAYDALTPDQRTTASFYAYVQASSTYGEEPFLTITQVTGRIDSWLKKYEAAPSAA